MKKDAVPPIETGNRKRELNFNQNTFNIQLTHRTNRWVKTEFFFCIERADTGWRLRDRRLCPANRCCQSVLGKNRWIYSSKYNFVHNSSVRPPHFCHVRHEIRSENGYTWQHNQSALDNDKLAWAYGLKIMKSIWYVSWHMQTLIAIILRFG